MTLRRWLLLTVIALGAGGVLVFGLTACSTPFIPLPPPSDPSFTPIVVDDGMGGVRMTWETRGTVAGAEARVSVYNATLGEGIIVRSLADGSYVASPLEGREGDRVEIDFEAKDGQGGAGICRLLQRGLAQTPCPR